MNNVTTDPVMASIDIIGDLAKIAYHVKKGKKHTTLATIIDDTLEALSMGVSSVYFLAGAEDNTYRKCIETISQCEERSNEFEEFFGVSPSIVKKILDRNLFDDAILDIHIQDTKKETERSKMELWG